MYLLEKIHHILPVVTLLYILLNICFPAINHTSSIFFKGDIVGLFSEENMQYIISLITDTELPDWTYILDFTEHISSLATKE